MRGKCIPGNVVMGATYTAAAINALGDWVLGLLPIALVRKLELSRRSKVLVSCTLALGSVASTVTIVRIPYFWQLTRTNDIVHDFADLSIWSTVENGLGLVASSIATLRPLFRIMFKSSRTGISSPPPRYSPYLWRRSGRASIQRGTADESPMHYRMQEYNSSKARARGKEDSGLG
ncbi:uncharacterized protein F4822DRAFT_384783 [Hypoxylon trugodes]|uniref:uncharacterized protein n=1 Tax=Hypoxylon trugodes TaxID=326681 RepID=UPI0021A01B6E|nr:uncharacterized protein F4822DRAFT_384783 [Hypoxylon trugodes]KAI1393472.1 hypothetical protein F4822DRAFT_384783 [Hypoxylon trugodes]